MLTIKFARRFPASMISHADVLKTMNRIFRRAEVSVEFSQGYNPHMLLFFSPPLPLGINSESEYVYAAAQYQEGLLERFNTACPAGFEALDIFDVPKNPNLAHVVNWAEYHICSEGIGMLDFAKLRTAQNFFVEHRSKQGQTEQKDCRSYVGEVQVDGDDSIVARLKFGNVNLRADRFVTALWQFFGLEERKSDICKLKVFDSQQTEIDKILRS